MRTHALALAILLSGSLSDAAKISFTQRKRPNNSSALQKRSGKAPFKRPVLAATSGADDSDVDLSSFHDLLYIANVTVGGTEYPLQLDTGSSDLWVKGTSHPLPQSTQTTTTLNITYGIGHTFGNVAYATVEFAGITVPNQAFVDASDVSNPILGYGVDGIVGLGFTKLSSVDSTLQKAGKTDGKSLLYNLFADNPKEPNFIAFALQRTTDGGGDVEGSFTIGEYDDDYKDVANSPKIPTFPETDPTRWSVLLDALLVGTKAVPLSSVVSGAPSGKAVVMFDSGTSYTYAPEDVCNAIYSGIDGASFNSGLQQWVVPCDAEVDIALQFGSNVYPIHPLDVTPANLADSTMCVGSFVPQTVSVAGGQFDWLIGDNVMRSVYTVYDFGDFDSSGNMGNPFMQLLALVDPNQASQEFHKARGGTPSGNITYNAQNVSSSTGAASSSPSSSGSSVTLSAELADTLNKLQGYFPAMLAVMALNALVLLVLAGAAITYLCRRRGKARARRNPGRASPLPLQRTSSFGEMGLAMGGGDNGEPHVYQPVSMALTEDTFVPPSPAFSKPGFGDNLRPGDRPKSVA
ncbi:acid protease [Trametes coccinea BRFM310]|uniref:Acid protease n=1 Tax=Trametes coccinea (strain BRFM310) TaxID=1353009 RepID=A0A1Y2IUL8_TRAC3|nr:acid protease [Trametes coccinea BRFM310]